MNRKLKSAGRQLSLRAKFKNDHLVELVVMEGISQTTLAFLIPLEWNDSSKLTKPIKQEAEDENPNLGDQDEEQDEDLDNDQESDSDGEEEAQENDEN